jgi:LmbE family N-acetylglucosaminyl deacetylase
MRQSDIFSIRLTRLTTTQIILVVAAHPDDEILGCGGAMARHATEGDEVHILFLAEGVTARYPHADLEAAAAEIEAREEMARQAAKQLGAQEPCFIRNPDNRLDMVPLIDLAKLVERKIVSVTPSTIYTHHGGDLNIDHRRVHEAVVTACRPMATHPVKSIYGFEVLSSTDWALSNAFEPFRPRLFIDIADYLERKLGALDCYEGELRPFPHPRSREAAMALAKCRGATAGCLAAEGFEVLRQIR